MTEEERRRLEKIIVEGAKFVGVTSGAIVGALVAGPVGGAVGAGAGYGIEKVVGGAGLEAVRRTLGRNEERRIGMALAVAGGRISARRMSGDEVRRDSFFAAGPQGEPSAADEVAEGVLLAAQREHEERKVRYLGNLLANVAFDESVGLATANALLATVERLTYRQLCVLAAFELNDAGDAVLVPGGNSATPSDLLTETYELFALGLIDNGSGGAQFRAVAITPHTIDPADLALSSYGAKFVELAALDEVPRADVLGLRALFAPRARAPLGGS